MVNNFQIRNKTAAKQLSPVSGWQASDCQVINMQNLYYPSIDQDQNEEDALIDNLLMDSQVY